MFSLSFKTTSRQVLKSNLLVRFLEETSAWKNHFEFVWSLRNNKKVIMWVLHPQTAKPNYFEIRPIRGQHFQNFNFRVSNLVLLFVDGTITAAPSDYFLPLLLHKCSKFVDVQSSISRIVLFWQSDWGTSLHNHLLILRIQFVRIEYKNSIKELIEFC